MPLSEAPTIVNRPGGVQESSLHRPFGAPPPLKEATLARRKAMQDALVQRLVKKFASNDRVKRQLVAGEVHEFFEKAGYGAKLGPADLQRLEANVRAAVAAADPNATDSFLADRAHKNELQMVRSHDIRTMDLQPGTIADLQGVANWNAVSKYRAGFNKTAQLQEEEKRQAGVEAMRVNLAHQRSHMAAMKRAKVEERAREQAASERLQAEYKADMEREKAKADEKARPIPANSPRPPPSRRPRRSLPALTATLTPTPFPPPFQIRLEQEARAEQIGQRKARRAVEQRLKELEEREFKRLLAEEQQAERQKLIDKVAAQERQNKLTAVANERSRAIAAARQQSEEDEEARLNAEWKAILDKQEADRAMRLEELKKRIAAQQRAYESGAGAQDRDRMRKEEEARERWHKEFEERTAAEEKAKQARLRKQQEDCDALQRFQIEELERRREERREEDRQTKRFIEGEALKFREKQADDEAKERADALRMQSLQLAQIAEKRSRSDNDMTPLEMVINRDLLVTMKSGKYGQALPMIG